MQQTLAGFIHGLVLRRIGPAKALLPYCVNRTLSRAGIRDAIEADLTAGHIDAARRVILLDYLDRAHEDWKAAGRLPSARDTKDWRDLGNGAWVRRVHREQNYVARAESDM